jgi:hypothetical protein
MKRFIGYVERSSFMIPYNLEFLWINMKEVLNSADILMEATHIKF